MSKNFFIMDERERGTFRRICTTLYIITLYVLMGVISYRQFVLHQPSREWNDIAILFTINVVVLLGSVLFLGGRINPKRIKLGYIVAGYAGFVLLGFLFTIFKYTVLLGQDAGPAQLWDYLFTVAKISGLLALAWGVLAYLGSRRIEKQIE